MHNKISVHAVIALSVLIGAPAGAQAQTAEQYNRAAQAMQLCASPAGAMVPECAQLRGAVGAPAAPSAANALGSLFGGGGSGGSKAAAAAGLLGLATQAAAAAKAKTVAAPQAPVQFGAPVPAAYDRNTNTALAVQGATAAYHACVAQVGPTNAPGVQGCLAQTQAASGGAAAAPTASTASAVGSAAVNVLGSLLRR